MVVLVVLLTGSNVGGAQIVLQPLGRWSLAELNGLQIGVGNPGWRGTVET